ncbi:propionyl-CoA synthetase [Iodidimonas sp. SYSU 1G8]|uniref:propionyl-CoA synthetase n=1 Tax=Iodidimonas sp. SYSU 1G8 TaxID=3133967 RepID=UPI0031FEA523
MSQYDTAYASASRDPDAFWADAARHVHWEKPWDRVLDDSRAPFYRWFAGARVNTCYNCLDRHVEAGRGEQDALIYDSPITGTIRHFTYRELLARVAKAAGGLAALGVGKGDRVIIYMPMVPEAIIAMLACARIGAVHSVVFGGFAAHELATRIDDATPKVILSASCGIEPGRVVPYKPLLDKAIALSAAKVGACVILQREQAPAALIEGRDVDWAEWEAAAAPAGCVTVDATDPLYILYTSGTTGEPKGIVRDNGGHLVALAWSMRNIYGVEPGEVFWAASDVGWVVGHSYICYGPLLNGNTSILFEGKPVGTPDAATYWRLIERHQVKVMFTAPTALRAIKQQDPDGQLAGNFDLSRFAALFVAGERGDPDTIRWAERTLGVPVIDHWWQTETGWPINANHRGLGFYPVKHGSPGKPAPGFDVQVVDEAARPVAAGETGAIVIKLPLPPGCFPTLWGHDEAFREKYLTDFPGFYKTGDAGFIDEDGYLFVMSRTDDVINVAGHRLSTGAIEEVLGGHGDVAECAVFGVADPLKGQVPLGLVVLKAGTNRHHAEIIRELVALVRDQIGPVAAFKTAAVVPRLPKTRSGKILRGTMQKIADGAPWAMPATIDDPATLDDVGVALRGAGYAPDQKAEPA